MARQVSKCNAGPVTISVTICEPIETKQNENGSQRRAFFPLAGSFARWDLSTIDRGYLMLSIIERYRANEASGRIEAIFHTEMRGSLFLKESKHRLVLLPATHRGANKLRDRGEVSESASTAFLFDELCIKNGQAPFSLVPSFHRCPLQFYRSTSLHIYTG